MIKRFLYYAINFSKNSHLSVSVRQFFFSFSWNILVIFEYLLQRYSQDRIRHLRWGVLRKSLHLICFTGFEYTSVLTEADVCMCFIENLVINILRRKTKKKSLFLNWHNHVCFLTCKMSRESCFSEHFMVTVSNFSLFSRDLLYKK